MPPLRTLLAVPVSLALLALASGAHPARAVPPTDTLLPLLVARGGAPAAALLALEETGPRYAEAGPGIGRADHFRAGSVTKTFIATVVLQLADEGRLSLSDTVERHLPGLVRGAGDDGRGLTLRSLLTHTSGLHDFSADTRGTVPVPPLQAVRIALTRTAHGSYGMGLLPVTLPCGTTVWGHNGRIPGSYVRTAATADGRRVLTFRVNTDSPADPGLESAVLTAQFCPRPPWDDRVPDGDPGSRRPSE
ncbi:serine hydrolase domain-containing protein [Streptomyces sp. NPDC126497]|uniref:serine hydrolase domain-containing protein n=1 Tax=Streptomyces sp. NPDC126497 TaxID=3155313 RepID=UPI0033191259